MEVAGVGLPVVQETVHDTKDGDSSILRAWGWRRGAKGEGWRGGRGGGKDAPEVLWWKREGTGLSKSPLVSQRGLRVTID